MTNLSGNDILILKSAGFQPYEISHIKAGRLDRISKKKNKLFLSIIKPRKKRNTKPISIENGIIKLKPFVKLKTWSNS